MYTFLIFNFEINHNHMSDFAVNNVIIYALRSLITFTYMPCQQRLELLLVKATEKSKDTKTIATGDKERVAFNINKMHYKHTSSASTKRRSEGQNLTKDKAASFSSHINEKVNDLNTKKNNIHQMTDRVLKIAL